MDRQLKQVEASSAQQAALSASQRARLAARERAEVPASRAEAMPGTGRTRRLPPRPSWMGSEEQATTDAKVAMAEMQRFKNMRSKNS